MDELGNPRPKVTWPWLYAIVAVMVGLLAAVETTVPDGALRRTLQCVAVIMFVSMAIWVRVNRVAIAVAEGDGGAPRARAMTRR